MIFFVGFTFFVWPVFLFGFGKLELTTNKNRIIMRIIKAHGMGLI
jgi:hypothetical protein